MNFPRLGSYPNQLTIERWIPWAQVYGQNEDSPAEDLASGGTEGGQR